MKPAGFSCAGILIDARTDSQAALLGRTLMCRRSESAGAAEGQQRTDTQPPARRCVPLPAAAALPSLGALLGPGPGQPRKQASRSRTS